jgi:hypothetical protein
MKARLSIPVVLACLIGLSSSFASAQTTSAQARIYRLTEQSAFQEGCFGACLCPVIDSSPMEGTFKLVPAGQDVQFVNFKVLDVAWRVLRTDSELLINGFGTYRISEGFPRMHQLQLTLKVGDRDVEPYDSGLVPVGSDFPAIDTTLTIAGLACSRIGIKVSALPVPPTDLAPYSIFGSSFLEGCFGPCLCAVRSQPATGKFSLLKIREVAGNTDFAVVAINWLVGSSNTTSAADAFAVSGAGLYLTSSNPKEERMILNLSLGGREPQWFDSGPVPGGGSLRRIDLLIAANGVACFDQVFDLHARRLRLNTALPSYRPQF